MSIEHDVNAAEAYVNKLRDRVPLLSRWIIKVEVEDLKCAAANITYDWQLEKALIRLSPSWRSRSLGTLEDLMNHEIGHLFADEDQSEEQRASLVAALLAAIGEEEEHDVRGRKEAQRGKGREAQA